ncbi:MAG: ATP synthase subunit C [Ruminiclostridium sp.]
MLFLLPLFALILIIVPLVIAIRKAKLGIKVNRKRTVLLNGGAFMGVMVLMTVLMPVIAGAEGAAEVVAAGGTTVGDGLKALAAALSTGFATIGTGIAVGNAASAAIGATSEDEKNFTKSLIFVALGEGVAIYGLLISILILFS